MTLVCYIFFLSRLNFKVSGSIKDTATDGTLGLNLF